MAAGFDFRHYRLRPKNGRGGTSLFELDIAPTQAAKKAILKRRRCARLVQRDGSPTIAYAELDLGEDKVGCMFICYAHAFTWAQG